MVGSARNLSQDVGALVVSGLSDCRELNWEASVRV
jgi:hypothetical protein